MEYLETIKTIDYIISILFLSLVVINLNYALKVYIDKRNIFFTILTTILIAIISIAGIIVSYNYYNDLPLF